MNIRHKLLAALILLAFSGFSQVGTKNFIDQNYIEVNGKAEMEVAPDEIYLKILLSEKDSKNKIPVSELEKQMASKLTDLGIDVSKDLVIKDLGSNFKYYLLNRDAIVLTKEYQLKVNSGKLASKVFLELEKVGISNISVDKLEHSKITEFKNDIKVDAIKAAKEKAEILSSAVGQTIGKAIFIQEMNSYRQNTASNSIRIRGASSLSEPEPLDIDFEKIKLEYSVFVRFELK